MSLITPRRALWLLTMLALPLHSTRVRAEPDGYRATSLGSQTMAVDFSAGMSSGESMLREGQTTVRISFHTRCVR